jgi:hypothetical protein
MSSKQLGPFQFQTRPSRIGAFSSRSSAIDVPKSILLAASGLRRVNKKEHTLKRAHETLVGLSKTANWGKTFRIAYILVTTPVGEACMVCTQ